MNKRLQEMKWIWCLLVMYLGVPVKGGALPNSANPPSTIESQAKFFQDFFSVQLSPHNLEFGHVCEDPDTWEQRYEKKDYKNHRDMGKVRWGDKKGGYGEHYWDLNHAGHTGDHGNDDYDTQNQHEDSYEEPSDDTPAYEPVDNEFYEESERIKRADLEKARKDLLREGQYDHEKHQRELEAEQKVIKEQSKPREKNHIVLVVNQRDRGINRDNNNNYNEEAREHVPYEISSGVRQRHRFESVPSASTPRLFFESSTGRVIDRATGRAYVLQPVQ